MTDRHYPLHRDEPVAPSPDLPALERDVLAHWAADGTFQASIDQRPAGENGSNEYVFYDGPPFANGLPHYGHLLTGYAKDVVPRYRTMQGQRVERRFGWDTHGLPAELEAQRLLGITDKAQIEQMGIAAFNDACRDSVLKYTQEWREYVTRQARWVDFDHDYKTLDVTFMESVIWAFKQLYDKGLAYEGHRVLPYCWVDETPLSNHELRMDDDVYATRQDPALTVGLRLETGELALIWTTTPWTLPSNLAVAVGPQIEYVVVEPAADSPFGQAHPGERVLLAAPRLAAYARELGEATVVETVLGADLAGRRYTPPFDYFAGHENAHRVLVADFVTTEDGSGIVHLAPAFGEDDMAACDAAGIASIVPVDEKGRFTAQVADYAGTQVFEGNKPIIADLKAGTGPLARVPADRRAVVVRHETYEHSYPHCWRCRNPLIYKAVSSWFVRVTDYRDRMVELNQEITWIPEHIKDGQFGKWLSGARDWSISRNRYWGTPIPVWVSDDPEHPRVDAYGSLAELERDFGRVPTNAAGEPDLHRPFIDELTRPNPDDPTGRSTMRRIPDVLDVWFDSGSMPFAQVHYPFENADWFEHHYPGDFIVEYIGQTRGWFYTLHVLATGIFDRPAFRNVMCHGIVLGDDGRKASKSLRNFPDPVEMWDVYGSDAVRWSLMSSPILRGGNLIVAEEGIRDGVRQVLLPLWSTYYFFTLYAGAARGGAGLRAARVDEAGAGALRTADRDLLARTRELVADVTRLLDEYDVSGACEAVRQHLDVLTNWYVRTQRQRFWDEDQAAFDTLFTALETLTRVMAPLAPLVTEEIWRGLTGGRSVHLTDWPTPDELVTAPGAGAAAVADGVPLTGAEFTDAELVAAMDRVREIVSAAHALRKANGLRVRQPLRELRVAIPFPHLAVPFADLVATEVNVRSVQVLSVDDASASEFGVWTRLDVNARAAGPRLGRAVQTVIRAAKAGDWEQTADGVVVRTPDGDVPLLEPEYTLVAAVRDEEGDEVAAAVLPGRGFVVLDIGLDDELRAEGYARDVVRAVQDARKAAGLNVADRITLTLTVPAEHVGAVEAHRDFVAAETLALDVTIEPGAELAAHVVRAEA
ncbi:isoleucine--tRNA ligase [Cellulomonas gilvus]|uniref:Isoleucine--tRNA ligase n=1 Tax=Cellulomonas gilvus (strain ATCC 13127 / NRRL B-14078) TaxID=593907 RepID=F8A066_CELGA|nr:isoleucine--tRNA ligase [Cellulomonas gilvus]AEI12630.1 isoleucyl-tRNA synthetase [Cellulomonas gilvus ATCC 13127]